MTEVDQVEITVHSQLKQEKKKAGKKKRSEWERLETSHFYTDL